MFWAVVCTILLIYGFEVSSRWHQLGGFLAVVPLFGAASREALFALVFAFGLWIFRKKGRKKYWVGAALGLMFSFIMVFAGQTIIDRTMVIFNLNGISSLTSNTTGTGAAQGSTISRDDSGLFNIRMRFLLWQDALAKWGGSPICGLGFGRFNDTITQYDGIENLCQVATAGQKNYADQIQFSKDDEILSTGNAHNTYFQVLAELGLIGIILLIGLWLCFWKRFGDTIREAKRILAVRDEIDANNLLFLNRAVALSTAVRGAIVCVGFGALFGDAWMAPSNMLILVAAIAVAEIVRRLILAFDEDHRSSMAAAKPAT